MLVSKQQSIMEEIVLEPRYATLQLLRKNKIFKSEYNITLQHLTHLVKQISLYCSRCVCVFRLWKTTLLGNNIRDNVSSSSRQLWKQSSLPLLYSQSIQSHADDNFSDFCCWVQEQLYLWQPYGRYIIVIVAGSLFCLLSIGNTLTLCK